MESIMAENKGILKVAILGAESTGKTTLCRDLALHYRTVWVPEYAREYVEKLDRPYLLNDLLLIAKQHSINEENAIRQANKILFTDTEFIILKVWSEEAFHSIPDFIASHLQHQHYDLYLVMDNTIPWEFDLVRENPDKRDYLLACYIKELEAIKANYKIISGIGEERLKNAIKEVDLLLKN
jgi:NadR type nicotinamide-nucleotide adenylyltransferase